jgi:nucleolar protein 4
VKRATLEERKKRKQDTTAAAAAAEEDGEAAAAPAAGPVAKRARPAPAPTPGEVSAAAHRGSCADLGSPPCKQRPPAWVCSHVCALDSLAAVLRHMQQHMASGHPCVHQTPLSLHPSHPPSVLQAAAAAAKHQAVRTIALGGTTPATLPAALQLARAAGGLAEVQDPPPPGAVERAHLAADGCSGPVVFLVYATVGGWVWGVWGVWGAGCVCVGGGGEVAMRQGTGTCVGKHRTDTIPA